MTAIDAQAMTIDVPAERVAELRAELLHWASSAAETLHMAIDKEAFKSAGSAMADLGEALGGLNPLGMEPGPADRDGIAFAATPDMWARLAAQALAVDCVGEDFAAAIQAGDVPRVHRLARSAEWWIGVRERFAADDTREPAVVT